MPGLSQRMRDEYELLFATCVIKPSRAKSVEDTVRKVLANRERYTAVADSIRIPWYFVGAVHNMESSLSFKKHLHNGDPLTGRTFNEPAGRPRTGDPPLTWEESAADALNQKRLGPDTDWSLAGTLYQFERYNGFGYRQYHPHVLSPYLWSFSEHYSSGKYVADGTWSDAAVSSQCGAGVILRRLAELGELEFADQPPPAPGRAVLCHSNKRPKDAETLARVYELQYWLDSHPGIFLKADGVPGDLTSDAYRRVTGRYLPGDPRR